MLRHGALRSLPSVALVLTTAVACAQTGETPAGESPRPGPAAVERSEAVTGNVVVISLDGFNPVALRRTREAGTPVLHRLIAEGASTLNARTEHEQTHTLPNHTGMITGRRVDADTGGHGVTWNDDRKTPRTVQSAAGTPVSSVFDVVRDSGRSAALFASKKKFSLWERSWPKAIDESKIIEDNLRLVRAVQRDLGSTTRALRFVHLSQTDTVGHASGFMSAAYLDAVRSSDQVVGQVIRTIENTPALAASTTVIVTSDHGGFGRGHGNPEKRFNYRVPMIVWGAGVEGGTDLYDLNSDYTDPGSARTTYADAPVRNGDVANLALDLLGLSAVPGSEHNAAQDLDVSR